MKRDSIMPLTIKRMTHDTNESPRQLPHGATVGLV